MAESYTVEQLRVLGDAGVVYPIEVVQVGKRWAWRVGGRWVRSRRSDPQLHGSIDSALSWWASRLGNLPQTIVVHPAQAA